MKPSKAPTGASGPAAEAARLQALDADRAFAGGAPRLPLAAPSFVLPGTVAENCAFLADYFPEVGLCLFETEACLAYTGADLPTWLGALPLRFHAHLPLDLPWEAGVKEVAEVILALAKTVAPCRPWAYVLHPPGAPDDLARLAGLLAAGGLPPERLLVENIRGRDLAEAWPVVTRLGLSVCLDLGHLLAHSQEDFLDLPGLFARVRMLHLNAPDPDKPGRHAALDRLDAGGVSALERMLRGARKDTVAMLELFTPQTLFSSLAWLGGFPAARADKA